MCQTSYALVIPVLSKRIVNGFLITNELGSSAISVFKDTADGLYGCGGTLISPNHVLTAAHCVVEGKNVIVPAANMTIGYNSYDRAQQKLGKVRNIAIHPEYFSQGQDGIADIAIMEIDDLVGAADFNQRVPIYDGPIGNNQSMLAVGWGKTEDSAGNLLSLRGVVVISGNQALCGTFSNAYVDNNGPQICAPGALAPFHSTCSGDSGSGLLVNYNGTLMVAGVVSTALNIDDTECGNPSGVHMFVHASYYTDFIMENTGLSKEYLTGLTDASEAV
ncbi:hypothetical protein GGF37_005140 [Kickxella alabastrina]|nr:hypothetical protein GGF37_005140 [Kickxella alabastrina]